MSATRPNWDDYFLELADTVALRADCTRRQVGAVIVKDRRIVATGYNGGPSGGPSCLAGQCPRGRMSADQVAPGSSYDTSAGACVALHAEQNAILWSAREDRIGATIYINHAPCDGCARLIAGSGLSDVLYRESAGFALHRFVDPARGYPWLFATPPAALPA